MDVITSNSLDILVNKCDPILLKASIFKFGDEQAYRYICDREEGSSSKEYSAVHAWSDQVMLVSSNSGQAALASIRKKLPKEKLTEFHQLENQYDRSIWLYLYSDTLFGFVVKRLVSDDPRLETPRSTFGVSRNLAIQLHQFELFRLKIAERLSTTDLDVAVQYQWHQYQNTETEVMHEFTVLCNRLPVEVARVDNGFVDTGSERKAYKLSVTYSPVSGYVDVYSKCFNFRQELALVFCETILGISTAGNAFQIKEYHYQNIVDQRLLNIEDEEVSWIKVTELAADIQGRKMVFELGANDPYTIKDALQDTFGQHFDLSRHPLISATIVLRLNENGVLPQRDVEIILKNQLSCCIKAKNTQDKILCNRLLRKWGILEEARYGETA